MIENLENLILEIKNGNIDLILTDDNQLIAKEPITPPLLRLLKKYKKEIIDYLTPAKIPSEILTMSAKEFEQANLIVRIDSEALKEDIYLISNKQLLDRVKNKDLVCYLPREILALENTDTEVLHNVHLSKKIFRGIIESG